MKLSRRLYLAVVKWSGEMQFYCITDDGTGLLAI